MSALDSPFVQCKIRQSISLLPCHIGEPRLGIDQEMTSMLMQYSEKLRGVILSFSNAKLQRPTGSIMNEQPYIHCKVEADALVFQPREGMMLDAVVNKIGSNHIGMLFAGVFNGSVAASELPKGFVHNYAEDCWIGADKSSISVEDTVRVKVLRVHVAGGMIAIEASMRTGSSKAAKDKKAHRKSVDLAAEAPAPQKKKASKKHKAVEPIAVVDASPAKTKKRKKDHAKDESAAQAKVTANGADKSHKKKKTKKSKKE